MSDCAWVTQALDEESVGRALVLGISLKRVLTRKRIVVVVRPSLPPALRDTLETTFDLVLCLDQGKCGLLEEMQVTADALGAAFALNLTLFQRCVYLPPNCLVLKNCDEIFDRKMCRPQNGSSIQQLNAFRFQPSREAFKSLTEFMMANKAIENGGFHSDGALLKWAQNQSADNFNFIEEPYFIEITLQGKQLEKSDDNLIIGRLVDLPPNVDNMSPEKNSFSSAGLLQQFIYDHWLEIYTTQVRALISKPGSAGGISITLPQLASISSSNLEPIAIVGMSCRYPSSNNLSEFWRLLIEGRDGIRTPPDHRWRKEQSLSLHNFSDTRKTQAGFLSVPVDEFDAKFFGISPKEMIFIDPQHRILHELVWEALEDAAINPLALNATNCGVFMGSWRNDYYDIIQRSSCKEFYRGYMGNSIGSGAARISHLLGLTGPCVATESGCSAAMVAVHMAVKSLQLGESGMAIACGVNMLLHPFTTDIMPMVTAPDGHCKSFDASADGFGRAEGCGVLVLKRLSDAVKESHMIWGVIKGTAITQEGISKSMGTPTVHCESLAMENALRDANVHSSLVSYVESHGTGTIVGDPLEVAAIGRVYGGRDRKEPLVIGSVKTNVGHTEACSGITGIMKVVLSLKNQVIPPHRNFKQLNPDINLDAIPAQLPIEPVAWPKIPGKPRTAGVSSFGITGTDGHVILQESLDFPSQRIVLKGFERPLHLMTISARSEEALDILVERYKTALMARPPEASEEDAFADMAYTANVGRAAFNWRACVVAKDACDAIHVLDSNKLLKAEVASEDTLGKICFLFTGQGSQYHGMSKCLYETSPVFQMHFDRCEEILKKCYKISIAKAFWTDEKENEDLVNRTLFSQTGIFVVEYCLMKLWESWGVKPDYVLGHSLGEFCAAVCAGVLTLEEALVLVAERSRLIDALPQGKMLVVKSDKSTVDNLLKRYSTEVENESYFWLDCAAVNSCDQTVLAGNAENIVRFSDWLEEKGVKSSVLKSSHAFHSRHMDPMLEEYKAIARSIFEGKSKPIQLSCSYVSGVLGKMLGGPVDWPDYWVRHTREKVNFLNASKAIYHEEGCRLFLEIGPHPVLSALTMINNDGAKQPLVTLPSLRKNEPDWNTMLTSVAKLFLTGATTIDWKRFDQFYARKKIGQLLPSYPFIGQKYWPNIVSGSGVQIHPLLGSIIPNPTSTKMFQNVLSLQNVEYLKDHMIGSLVVFPGAGYLETLLMSGHATLDGNTTEFRYPKRPIQLENFRIEAPLELEVGTGCSCQTVVEFNSSDSSGGGALYAKMYHEKKEDGGQGSSSKWVAHASATFSTYNPGSVQVENRDFYKSVMESLKTSGKEEEENVTRDFYEKVADVGLKFGPAFRILTKVWRGMEDTEFLAQVQLPEDCESYLVHPTIIDAMIQASVFQGGKSRKMEKKLRVPIACEKFVWFRPLSRSTEQEDEENVCYIYSKSDSSKTIVLLEKSGDPIAALVKVEAIETNAKSIHALLETQTKSIPDMYKMQWKSTLGPGQRRLDFGIIKDGVQVCANEPDDQSDYSEETMQQRRDVDAVVFYHVITAFLKLGWSPLGNDVIVLEKFLKQLGIRGQYRQLVRVYLTYLEQENILEGRDIPSGDGERQWSVKMLPGAIEEYQSKCKYAMEKLNQADSIRDQVLLVQSVGEKLDKILSGTESALRILFPDDKNQPSAAKFYDTGFKLSKDMVTRNWYKLWENIKKSYEGKAMPVIRFLEVGAGTGFFTSCIVDTLEAHDLQYEYHYTDISAAFFPAAEKRFEKMKRNFKFMKLDLEQDPTSQGFPPNYYDFICGAQVVHATRDIKETFLNLRTLLRHNGNLVLVEQLGGCRKSDCTFGLLEGFWRFTDFELRPHHTNLGMDKWLEVGHLTGFSKVAYSRIYENAVIAYRANHENGGGDLSYRRLSATLNAGMKKTQKEEQVAWLIFYGGEEEEKFVEKINQRFEYIGRKRVILVKHSKEQSVGRRECQLQEKYSIRPDVKEDMDNLLDLLATKVNDDSCEFSRIEGILITWGLHGGEETSDQSEIAKPFLHLIQRVLKMDKKTLPQIVILTAGQYEVGDVLCENPGSSTLLGISKCLANEHSELRIRGVDMSPHELHSTSEEIFQEIFTGFNGDSVGHFCAFRGGDRYIPKLLPEKLLQQKLGSVLPLPPGTDRFQLIHPKSKSIQDLEFGDLELFTLKPGEIEVKVKCSALNFKDILNVLKPTEEFKESNGVGFDFAGVVTAVGEGVTERKVGDPVFGINIMGNALPSHIKLPGDAVVTVPDKCSFSEAACFPAVFSTAYYCLVTIARAKKGETLLIHTASGGVGLLTIQLAKYLGLNIICTAGSQRKRAYLRSLGIQHVLHSRNTEYGREIMEVTNGRGVDIVMNSLTSQGFKEATLESCAEGARFVEMSKLNIWSAEEVAERRPDVQYTIVDLTKLDETTSRKLLGESKSLLEDGVVSSIPYTRFDAQNIREALTYLQKAQHIGKVVVSMPELKPGQMELSQVYTPLYNDKSTYLITGGLGGVGMEVCKYLVAQGAKNVVLVGRKPPSESATETICTLRKGGNANIVVLQADVGDWTQCQQLFQKIQDPLHKLPPLRGIMHCAGTLSDTLIENAKWSDFAATYQAKINGSWNLHHLTKHMILEHFVLFSSITAPFGSPGQASHVSACTFEDTMAHFRISHGLPATTINWGQFGQVGVAAEADVYAVRPFTPEQGLNALDCILRQNGNHIVVVSFESALAAAIKYLPYTKRIIDQQVLKMTDSSHSSKKSLHLSSEQFWEEYNECGDEREAKVEMIRKYTKIFLRHVLRLDSDEHIDDNVELQELGVDSLMMLELKNLLQEILGDRVTITQAAMKDCNTVNLLSDRLVQVIEEEGEFSSVEPPTLEEIRNMVLEDIKLPENIHARVPGSEKKPSQIKVLLMTGATGSLGSHMLREILEECSQLEKVYCLVRTPRGGESAQERLTTVLERKCVMNHMKNYDKVECLSGNFIEANFGLSEEEYQHLCAEVDAVVHCGAKVSHLEYYRNVSGGRNDARSVNVGGLLKILKFAGESRTKHVFNMSTMLTSHEVDEKDGSLYEGWPVDLSPPYNRGYIVSKYIGDFLLKEANDRGIPCKTFKFAELRGSKVTGGSLMTSSHFMKSFLFFMKEGIMPETPLPSNFLPIDLASRIAARVMFSDTAPNSVYNVTHPQPQLAQEYFPKLAKEFGHPVSLVSWEEYRKIVARGGGGDGAKDSQVKNKDREALLSEFKELYDDEAGFAASFMGSTKSIQTFLNGAFDFFRSKLLSEFVPDLYAEVESSYEIHRRDFLAAKNEGVFEKLGL